MRSRELVVLWLVAASGVLVGCGWLVGVNGDVTLATDAGADDEADGAERPPTDAGDAEPADIGPFSDGSDEADANWRDDGEAERDASRFDAARDARDD